MTYLQDQVAHCCLRGLAQPAPPAPLDRQHDLAGNVISSGNEMIECTHSQLQ